MHGFISPHQPVMVEAVLSGLQVQTRREAVYIDGTVGAGGHSQAILAARSDNRVLGLDLDPDALAVARQNLDGYLCRVQLVQASYLDMLSLSKTHLGTSQVDGILLDLGVSSIQLDNAERGFAFRLEGPLDMRFDPTSDSPTAADLVNTLPVDALADILFHYGEERHSRRIAQAIARARPIRSTSELASLISSLHVSHEKIHPATRSFQALRIAVNHELDAVEQVLPIALTCLKPGGRLAIITFHSLEDRIVKRFFKQEVIDCICPPRQPVCTCNHQATLKLITRKPLIASDQEIRLNPRSRSAKLRIVEHL